MNLIEKNYCTGCMACVQICPQKCIDISEDKLGNLYPSIDNFRCMSCGKCQLSCPEYNQNEMSFYTSKKCYAAWSINSKIREKSTSGGVAATLYRVALNYGYMISGAEYSNDFHVIHTLTDSVDKIIDYQQSKYVYSEINNIYKNIKNKLEKKERVVFISLPCKVAGLKSFLGKEYENLVTVDIVCHGTPPFRHLKEHLDSIHVRREANNICFRNENEYLFELKKNDSTIYKKIGCRDTYIASFIEGLNYRSACYQCTYARPERIGDMTIGDFWGLGRKQLWEHSDSKSVSAVLINTEKGMKFLELASNMLFLEERPVSEAIEGNTQLNCPTKIHDKRKLFEYLYVSYGFEKAAKKCLKNEIKVGDWMLKKKEFRNKLQRIAGIFIKKYRRRK